MSNEFIDELANFITANGYVNIYSEGFSREEEDTRKELEKLHSKLAKEYDRFLLDIDINAFDGCESEDEEAEVLLKLIAALEKDNSKGPIHEAISIADALEKLSKKLDSRSLVVFHCFCDIHEEKEKDILRALRKFIEIFERVPYLGILIISSTRIDNWELFPESPLDGRHVVFKEYPQFS